jgi:hypothetical protein
MSTIVKRGVEELLEEVQGIRAVWMPHAGHLIVGRMCRFHLATYVNGHIISTVGEYLPDSTDREIFAQSRGADYLDKLGFEDVGYKRKYETRVFRAKRCGDPAGDCCPWRMANGTKLDLEGYNDPVEAYAGHLRMVIKWASADEPSAGR